VGTFLNVFITVSTERFFSYLFRGNYCLDDYKDIYEAMKKVYEKYKKGFKIRIEEGIQERLTFLEEAVKRAKTDDTFARELLKKLGY